eukprot:TRINITY_DN9985_c0_g1_i1.p1 TRINITY_DN9985_c0_g1~~TRINITY_DN9985_c0_g1_i1.p1  ORF type:complete len:205 (+),score=23.46 TRINITY_DN9985_c0_g1_i1:58-672(+)
MGSACCGSREGRKVEFEYGWFPTDTRNCCAGSPMASPRLTLTPRTPLVKLPQFSGVYQGNFVEADGKVTWDAVVDSRDFSQRSGMGEPGADQIYFVQGVIVYECVKCTVMKELEGKRGCEFIKGMAKKDGKTLQVSGYRVEPNTDLISCGNYELTVSENGDEIACRVRDVPNGEGDFILKRVEGSAGTSARRHIRPRPMGYAGA